MKLIKPVLASAGLVAQALSFVGFAYMLSDIVILPEVLFPGRSASVTELAPYALDTVMSYWAFIVVGTLGALATWLLIVKGQYLASWFLTTARILGWLWIPLLPLGTVLGILILRSRSRATREQSASS